MPAVKDSTNYKLNCSPLRCRRSEHKYCCTLGFIIFRAQIYLADLNFIHEFYIYIYIYMACELQDVGILAVLIRPKSSGKLYCVN